jgi:hypothetical protein
MQARQAETITSADQLRRLGPQVQPGEGVASLDEIQVRRPQKRRFLELGTAYVRTTDGYRYLSGSLALVLSQLFWLLLLGGGGCRLKSPCGGTAPVGSATSSRTAWLTGPRSA